MDFVSHTGMYILLIRYIGWLVCIPLECIYSLKITGVVLLFSQGVVLIPENYTCCLVFLTHGCIYGLKITGVGFCLSHGVYILPTNYRHQILFIIIGFYLLSSHRDVYIVLILHETRESYIAIVVAFTCNNVILGSIFSMRLCRFFQLITWPHARNSKITCLSVLYKPITGLFWS